MHPFTLQQIEYAALDCALPVWILDEMAEGAGSSKMSSILPYLASLIWFITLDSTQKDTMHLLKAKRVVGDTFLIMQSWIMNKTEPAISSVSEEEGGPYTDKSGVMRMPSYFVSVHSAAIQNSKNDANNNDNGNGNTSWKSLTRKAVGRSKEKCIKLLVLNAITSNATLEYNPCSRFIPFQDGITLFVNMPSLSDKERGDLHNQTNGLRMERY
eukprot:851456-Ditylum_brightwellii.AAC.1